MQEESQGRAEDDAWWAALAVSFLHPVQVQIIEALRWIDRPLSAGDLAEVVDTRLKRPQLVHHLRRLTHIHALEVDRPATLKDAFEAPFRLAGRGPGSPRS